MKLTTKFNTLLLPICLIISVLIAGEKTSSSSVNPFNKFMSPEGGVNLASGNVAFSQPVLSLRGRNGLNVNVTLSYSSNVYMNARAMNDKGATGWVGLGWRLGYGAIRCIHNGTMSHSDDDFFWISPQGVGQKILRNSEGTFFLEENPYWRVETIRESIGDVSDIIIGWELTDPSGNKYKYGNSDTRETVRHTFCWPSSKYEKPSFQFPIIT